jgi:hypothetical protein
MTAVYEKEDVLHLDDKHITSSDVSAAELEGGDIDTARLIRKV